MEVVPYWTFPLSYICHEPSVVLSFHLLRPCCLASKLEHMAVGTCRWVGLGFGGG